MNRFTQVREYLNLPSYKISGMVGKSRGAYSDWERGVANLRYDSLVKFQEVLNISPDYLLLGEGLMTTTGTFNYDFCTRLKEERVRLGQNQKDMAELLDVSRQYYNYIETGKIEPSRDFILSLREVTGKPLAYLIGGQI